MKVKAAAVQIAPDLTSASGTVDRMEAVLANAYRAGVELAVFPETFVPYYPYFSFVASPVKSGSAHLALYDEAVEVPGPITKRLGSLAAKYGMVLVVGVNERDKESLYNAQLIFDQDGQLILHRRKLTPSYHERMVWGNGDGSGLKIADTKIGRIGALACWEHYIPMARFALMVEHEQIHCSQFPGSMVGQIFADQIDVTIRHHALESGCFVVNSTGWLTDEQRAEIEPDEKLRKALTGGCFTTIISPEGKFLAEPITEGEGMAIAELDFSLITKRKRMLDSVGHYSRPDIFSLKIDKENRQQVDEDSVASTESKGVETKNDTNEGGSNDGFAKYGDQSKANAFV